MGCGMRDAGCGMRDAGCGMRDAGTARSIAIGAQGAGVLPASRIPRRSERAPTLPSDLRAVFVEVRGRKTYDTWDARSNTGEGGSVGVAERFNDALHDAARDLRALEGGEPVSGGTCREPAVESADERVAVSDAAGVGGEAWIVGEVGAIERER